LPVLLGKFATCETIRTLATRYSYDYSETNRTLPNIKCTYAEIRTPLPVPLLWRVDAVLSQRRIWYYPS